MFLLAVSVLSASALAYQVLLMRLLSVVLWHHFAAMVISLALLGYGISGTALTLTQDRLRGRISHAYPLGCGLFGVLAPGAFAVAQRVPFHPQEAVWDPWQWAAFGAMYLLLAVPFVLVGGCLGLAFRELRDRIPSLYRADLVGAGAGALGVLGLLFLLPPAECLRVVGAGGFVAAALGAAGLGRRSARGAVPLGVAALGAVVSLGWPASWLEPRPSEFKALSQALRTAGAAVTAEAWSPLGHLAAVESPEVPFRHAPGLSLGCPWDLPPQVALFSDGGFSGTVDRGDGDPRYRDCLPTGLPYRLAERRTVLVLGSGGGLEVQAALAQGAQNVDAVELDRRLLGLLDGPLRPHAGPVYDAPGVAVHAADARAFVARAHRRYDLIQISLLDALGASLAGTQAASESYLYTVEAFGSLLDRLEPGGVVSVTRWLELPPRGALKLFATAVEALERRGVASPGERLALVRTWSTATLLLREGPFPPEELRRLREACGALGYDLEWLPGLSAEEVNRHNVLDRPWLHEGALAILGPGRKAFYRDYKFFVEPATDDRPYFFRSFKWGSLPELLAARGRGGAALVEWASLFAPATLLQALLAGGALILLPLRVLRRAPRGGTGPRVVVYFASLGLGFLLIEISLIQRLTLLLGHPVYAAAATLAAFLAFAGLGSQASARWARSRSRAHALGGAILAVVALTLTYQAAVPWLFTHLAGLPLAARAAVAAGCIAPLAFFLGMPFPLGLQAVAARFPEAVPWVWGINGFASVVSAALAAVLGVHVGLSGVAVIAALLYLVAGWAGRGWREDAP
ncbi:MAG: hypothetical protein SCH98_13655 [Deferrisomatales bacterium]|nr:hypothetical protein [Deferrisomatales bacterium]